MAAFFLLAILPLVLAYEPSDYLPVDPFPLALYGFAFILVLSFLSIKFADKMSELHKKIVFVLVAIVVVGVTLYAGGTTVYLNLISESGGPAHWHADFEIWDCGEKVTDLAYTTGLESFVGTAVLHHHNDYRIHVEGVLIKKSNASLGSFFKAIGGDMTNNSISIPLNDGTIRTLKNGDLCNGRPGVLKLFVQNATTNGEFVENNQLSDYVLSPFFVPVTQDGEGDYLKIVFEPQGDS